MTAPKPRLAPCDDQRLYRDMAGPMGLERSCMFFAVVDEVDRCCRGKSLRGELSLDSLGRIG
jgi:hypothetical protein